MESKQAIATNVGNTATMPLPDSMVTMSMAPLPAGATLLPLAATAQQAEHASHPPDDVALHPTAMMTASRSAKATMTQPTVVAPT